MLPVFNLSYFQQTGERATTVYVTHVLAALTLLPNLQNQQEEAKVSLRWALFHSLCTHCGFFVQTGEVEH